MSPSVLQIGALRLARHLREGDYSPVEVVEAHLARIDEVNTRINAVVVSLFERARTEAREAERRLRVETSPPPLLGVPCTIKEMISVEGCPITLGSVYRRNLTAASDAAVVRHLRAAGAIPLGLTNLSEMGFWFECDNLVYGRTNNPWDVTRHPGGSSGGEAAIIAAGGSPFGVGSDIGGSIRMPAFFCGVFGHKPTAGRVPLDGHYPLDGTVDREPGSSIRYATIGPLARTSEDLGPLLEIMAGAEAAVPPDAPAADASLFRNRRVLVLDEPTIRWVRRPTAEIAAATRRAAQVFEHGGARVEPWSHPSFRRAVDIWHAMLAEQPGLSLGEVFTGGQRDHVPFWRELTRLLTGRPRHTLPALLFSLAERVGTFDRRIEQLVQEGRRLQSDLERDLDGDGILITPTHPRTALPHGRPLLRPMDFAYTAIFNALQVPVTAVPLGFDTEGLPLGAQIAAARGRDDMTIAAARVLEAAGEARWIDSAESLLRGHRTGYHTKTRTVALEEER